MVEMTVGLVGPGAIGQVHARAIAAVPGLRLVAVVGGSPERAAAITGAPAHFADTAAMLAARRPDIVVVTTPSGGHYEPAARAIDAGCHLLVEKPLAVDAGEAARLVGAAERAGITAATVSQRRLEPQHVHIAAELAKGTLGTPRLIEADVHWWRSDAYYAEKPWRADDGNGGGSLFNQGIHSLDLLLWLFGPVRSVAAFCGTLGHALPIEDSTVALLAFESGALGTLVTSTATPPGRPAGLRLFTERGSFAIEHDRTVRWEMDGVPPPPETAGSGSGASDPMAIGLSGHIETWRDFRDAILERRPPAVTFLDGCDAVRVTTAIYRAAAEGRSVALDELPRRL